MFYTSAVISFPPPIPRHLLFLLARSSNFLFFFSCQSLLIIVVRCMNPFITSPYAPPPPPHLNLSRSRPSTLTPQHIFLCINFLMMQNVLVFNLFFLVISGLYRYITGFYSNHFFFLFFSFLSHTLDPLQ